MSKKTKEHLKKQRKIRRLLTGHMSAISRELGISRQAVQHWHQIPGPYVRTVSKITGIPPEKLRRPL